MKVRSSASEYAIIGSVYFILTILVWGLFALDRGLWQDELIYLILIQTSSKGLLGQLLSPTASPTRILGKLPYWLAYQSGNFAIALQLFYGVMWLATGLLSYLIVRRLLAKRPLWAYIAGALTLTATSDFLTNSLVPVGIGISVAFYFTSLWLLLVWWQDRSWRAMILSGFFLLASLWMYDAAFFPILLTPFLLFVNNRFRFSKRLVATSAIWYALIIPYAIVFAKFLADPSSYAARAIHPMSVRQWFLATGDLVSNNFVPWVWALSRRQWFPALPPVISPVIKIVGSLFGTLAFVGASAWYRNRSAGEDSDAGTDLLYVVGIIATCIVMVIGSNVTYVPVHFSNVFYRTHWVSRVWSSIAIAIASYWAFMSIRKSWRPAVLLVPSFFVFWGTYGGLERQDYYLAYWKQHKAELQSIVDQVPGLRPDAYLILSTPKKPFYLATEATYLARAWLTYLYDDPTLFKRIFLWSRSRKAICSVDSGSFVCIGDGREKLVMPLAKTVLLEYSPSDNRFTLADKIPDEAIPDRSSSTQAYNPKTQILQGPIPHNARILQDREFLASFLDGAERHKGASVGR